MKEGTFWVFLGQSIMCLFFHCVDNQGFVSDVYLQLIIRVQRHIALFFLPRLMITHRETLEMPLAHYFHLSRQGQNDHFRCALCKFPQITNDFVQ